MPQPLCASLLAKIEEQIERTAHLIRLLPADRLQTVDAPGGWTVAVLLGHLLECLAGFCAALAAAAPEQLVHFASLRGLPVNHACGVAEALERIEDYRKHIAAGFEALADADLTRRI